MPPKKDQPAKKPPGKDGPGKAVNVKTGPVKRETDKTITKKVMPPVCKPPLVTPKEKSEKLKTQPRKASVKQDGSSNPIHSPSTSQASAKNGTTKGSDKMPPQTKPPPSIPKCATEAGKTVAKKVVKATVGSVENTAQKDKAKAGAEKMPPLTTPPKSLPEEQQTAIRKPRLSKAPLSDEDTTRKGKAKVGAKKMPPLTTPPRSLPEEQQTAPRKPRLPTTPLTAITGMTFVAEPKASSAKASAGTKKSEQKAETIMPPIHKPARKMLKSPPLDVQSEADIRFGGIRQVCAKTDGDYQYRESSTELLSANNSEPEPMIRTIEKPSSNKNEQSRVDSLVTAVETLETKKVLTLLKKGIPADKHDSRGKTALGEACKLGCVCLSLELCRAGHSPSFQDREGFTPAMYAAKHGGLLQTLLYQVPPDEIPDIIRVRDHDGRSLLHHVVLQSHPRNLNLLLEAPDTDANITDNAGDTPLHIAIREVNEKRLQRMHELIDAGADINKRNHSQQSCLELVQKMKLPSEPMRRSLLAALYARPPPEDVMPEGCTFVPMKIVGRTRAANLRRKVDTYTMNSRKRGLAIIVNNINFMSLGRREGAERDADRLKLLFERFHFQVVIWKNYTAQQFKTATKQVKGEEESSMGASGWCGTIHKDHSALIVVFMSHGEKDVVLSCDEKHLNIEKDIIQPFDGNHCQALIGKPKVFFIQACRGKGTARPVTIADSGLHDRSLPGECHAKSDIATIYSSYSGSKAMRDTSNGAWFLDEFILICELFAADDDLATLFEKANTLLEHRKAYYNSDVQVAQFDTSLKKKFYFMPEFEIHTSV